MRRSAAESNCTASFTQYICLMGGIIEAGEALLAQASRRLEINAANISNITTPGYKARVSLYNHGISFSSLLGGEDDTSGVGDNLSAGQARATGNPLDLIITGEGFFALNSPNGLVYSRNGQFHRDADGRLVNGAGMALQGTDGEIILKTDTPEILKDGTILEKGEPVARIPVYVAQDTSALRRAGDDFSAQSTAMRPAETAMIGQAMLETSNVSMAQEVLSMMQSQRSAETGQNLVRVYDDLMARAITAFGGAGS